MEFPRQESQAGSGLPFPTPGNLLDPGIKAASPASAALAGRYFIVCHLGSPKDWCNWLIKPSVTFFLFFRRNIWSSCLFNLYAGYFMRNARLDESQAGIKFSGRNSNNPRYADDTTFMAESKEELKNLLMKMKEENEKLA